MKKYAVLIVLSVLFLACRKEEVNKIDGPTLFDVYGEFSVLSDFMASQDTVNFTAGEQIHFTCELAKIVNWQLTITGQTSGARKIIAGTSKSLNASNASWNGSTTIFPMFRAETCNVMLTFENQSDTLYAEVAVSQPKINEGFVIADFENGWNSGWSTFVQSGLNMDFNIKTDEFAPQTNAYYNMQGEVSWDWLIGLVDFNASAYGASTLPLTDNGDNLYFNLLVYGEAGLANTLMLLRFDEDENEDGTFQEQSEDQFTYEFPVDWEGWRLVSVKYSDLDGGGAGGGTFNPDKINKVSILHLANPSSGFAKSRVDYLIFTENAPLNP